MRAGTIETGYGDAAEYSSASCSNPHQSLADVVFGAVLFMTVTESYRFVAVWMGFKSMAPVAGGFALIGLAYAAHHGRDARLPVSRLIGWGLFLLVLPLGSLIYSLNPNFRDMALQILYVSLLVGSKTFFARKPTRSLRGPLLDGALITGYVGLVWSIIDPGAFDVIASLTTIERRFYAGRGFGLYLQPNVCAPSLTLLFFLWLFVCRRKGIYRVVMIGAYFMAIFLTGSRGGMIMSVFLVFSHAALGGRMWNLPRFYGRVARLAVFGSVGLALVIAMVFALIPRLATGAVVTLDRIRGLTKYRQLAQGDDSVKDRLAIQRDYLGRIAERPLLGYGMGSAPVMRERGLFLRSSHNAFLEYTFSYGFVGVFLLVLVLLMTWQDGFAVRGHFQHKPDLLFLGIAFLACMVSNTILGNRILYVVVGWFLSHRYPRRQNDPTDLSTPVGQG